MIIDSHVHILPPRMRDSRDELAGADPWFDMCHQGGRSIITAGELLATMDATGIDRSVCFGWPFADPEHCAEANDHLIRVQREHGDRLTCFATVSPARPGAVDELRRCAGEGLRGVGELNADAQGFDLADTAADDVAGACNSSRDPAGAALQRTGRPRLPGQGHRDAGPGRWLCDASPGLKLVCAHLGGGLPFYAHMPEVAELCRRALVRHRGGAVPLRADRVSRGARSLSAPTGCSSGRTIRCFPRDATSTPSRRRSSRRGTRPRDGRERRRACLVCDNVPLPLHICVSASEATVRALCDTLVGRRNRRPPAGPSPLS